MENKIDLSNPKGGLVNLLKKKLDEVRKHHQQLTNKYVNLSNQNKKMKKIINRLTDGKFEEEMAK